MGPVYSRHPPPVPIVGREAIMAGEYDHPLAAVTERARKFAGNYRATGDAYAQRGDLRAAGVCEDAAADFDRIANAAETAMNRGARL